jgi:hypothetical protein
MIIESLIAGVVAFADESASSPEVTESNLAPQSGKEKRKRKIRKERKHGKPDAQSKPPHLK